MEERTRIPIWRLFLLSASTGALEVGYAVEGAYIVPFMVASGLSLSFATVLLTLSPVMGLLFQGFIGAVSDKCTCSWGRRRPFIVLFSLTAILGFAPLPYCYYIDQLYLKIITITLCVFLLDFSCGALMLPARAYLLDVVPISQTQTGNFIISVAIGAGAALGFGLGAIDWSVIAEISVTIEHQSKIMFGITAGIFIVTMICTIVSVKEQNPTQSTHASNGSTPTLTSEKETKFNGNETQAQSDSKTSEKQPLISKRTHKTCLPGLVQVFKVFFESVTVIIKFAYYMSYSMWSLWFMVMFALAGDFAFTYGFTTFVGVAVYEGDPSSSEDSLPYQSYAKGVRMGSLGLVIAMVFCSAVSLVLDYITRWVRLKTVLLISLAVFVCALCLLMYCRKLYQVYILVALYGPFFGIIQTVPFALIPVYEVRT